MTQAHSEATTLSGTASAGAASVASSTPGPIALAPNLIEHYYRGGDRIARMRGITTTSDHNPEEWLAATVTRDGEDTVGLARTQGGDVLRDLVVADPGAWVGPGHEGVAPGDVGILVKLLDARQRLPVHVHPDRAFASSHLDCPYGKTEAWFILETEPGRAVYLGWNTDVDSAELERARDEQDSEWMLSHMNRIEVEPGMGILVPAGTAHAIDDGIFLAEVQEPTDFSILLEWSVTTSTREESHLGIGFDAVMHAVSTSMLGPDELESLIARSDLGARPASAASMLPAAADPFFTLVHAAPGPGAANAIPAGFSVVLVLTGQATLSGSGSSSDVSAGEVFAVPHAYGDWTVVGDASILVAGPGRGWPQSLRRGIQP